MSGEANAKSSSNRTNSGRFWCQYEKTCLYCDAILHAAHEHDHMPIPKRYGGRETHCVCINCHDLKDRCRLEDWPIMALPQMVEMFENLPPIGRIFLARCMALAVGVTR